METIKEIFQYIQNEYPKNLEEIEVKKGVQRRLKNGKIEEQLNQDLNHLLQFDDIKIKIKLGPSYNRSLMPWIQLYTKDNRKGTKGHYGGISFEKQGRVALWLGFGQTGMKKWEIQEKRNQYISEYAKIETNLKHGFQYKEVYVDAVCISKKYVIEEIQEEEFYSDITYLMNLYKKHETNKKLGIVNNQPSTQEETEEVEQEEIIMQPLKKGRNKLYRGYTQNGKIKLLLEEFLYQRNPKSGKFVLDEKNRPLFINASQYEKVVFYEGYKREEFIYREDKLSSKYIVGPFLRILKRAISYPQLNFYLIIEEINQGNILQIFGELIHLLERRQDGRSQYETHDSIIASYLYGETGRTKAIYLPSNLIILATDNANGNKMDLFLQNKFEVEWVGSTNQELDNYYLKGFKKIKWGNLRNAINQQIELNTNKINVQEDEIDSYFLPEDMLTQQENTEELVEERVKIANKLFIYLYETICRYDTTIIFSEKIKKIEDLVGKVKSKNYIELLNEEIKQKLKE